MSTSLAEKESDVQAAILQYLAVRGHFAWRQNTMPVPIIRKRKLVGLRKAPMTGVSDVLCVQRGTGRLFAIEVKRPVNPSPTTPEQLEFLSNVRRAGGIGIVAKSIDDVQRAGL